ncbi:BNR/Asp-box repeat domain-containing protein [Phyllosticta citriasiana]|uniref:BNR/Asp-box repeat domain-containing protein n=1 Tax=Phyllosticta citriasiana TaxID=595635 RepID=UPI0030FD6332
MLWSSIFTGLAALVSVTNAVTVFTAPSTFKKPGVSYARAIVLDDGTFLVTSEHYSEEPPVMYFYESKDGGRSWYQKSRVEDTTPERAGLRYHPTLIQIPAALGQYPAGTIVFSAAAVPENIATTKILVFVSRDRAATWEYVSTVAEGGAALEQNLATPVWHPFFFFHDGKLLCYFSDSRDPAHGVKIVYSDTSDLRSWSDPVGQVAYEDRALRPTIATVTQIGDKPGVNGGPSVNQFLMTYEYGGAPETPFAVHYRISDDPRNFDPAPDFVLRGPNGEVPSGAPYAAYVGGGASPTDGTVIISSSNQYDLYVNRKADASGPWETLYTEAAQAYARCVVPLNAEQALVVGAGRLDPGNYGELNSILADVVDLKGLPPGSKSKTKAFKRWSA